MLWFDPGMGKTAIVLEALRAHPERLPALVIAPLRVCQTVWRQEAAKWTQFRDLSFAFLHGSKKKEILQGVFDGAGSNICLINPEGIAWLAKECGGLGGPGLPFKTVVFDEITRFKNARSERSKALRPLLKRIRQRWGLTGTPAPNGYLDLFGQFLVLDDGTALGRFYTHYRDKYFKADFNGFDWALQSGAELRIQEVIRPYVLSAKAEDYLELPDLVEDIRWVDLPPDARKLYDAMERDAVIDLPDTQLRSLSKDGFIEILGANAGAVYSKLKQIAHGAVYDEKHDYHEVHTAKLEAIGDLVEELAGAPILFGYEFQHDAERLAAYLSSRFDHIAEVPTMYSGMSDAKAARLVDDWNAGRLPILMAHPASAGHGLNLQGSGASHVGWFGPPWDFELWDQFIRRVRRQGNTTQHVINHIFMARDTIDELCLADKRAKGSTQTRLRDALGDQPKETVMTDKLGTGPQASVVPKGWAQAAPAPSAAVMEQKAAVAAKVTPPAAQQTTVGSAFSAAIKARMGQAAATPAPQPAQDPPAAPVGQEPAAAPPMTPAPPEAQAQPTAAPAPKASRQPKASSMLDRMRAVLVEIAEAGEAVEAHVRVQAAATLIDLEKSLGSL